ncbi:MAG: hypothetical protein IPG44_11480 [Anaerolineales bacterium]|nr:hypothetical protein [Anaerolineales bacterium]
MEAPSGLTVESVKTDFHVLRRGFQSPAESDWIANSHRSRTPRGRRVHFNGLPCTEKGIHPRRIPLRDKPLLKRQFIPRRIPLRDEPLLKRRFIPRRILLRHERRWNGDSAAESIAPRAFIENHCLQS